MPTMILRKVPDELHAWLKQQAHHGSVNKEAIALLDRLRGKVPAARQRTTVEAGLGLLSARAVQRIPEAEIRRLIGQRLLSLDEASKDTPGLPGSTWQGTKRPMRLAGHDGP